MLCLRFTAVLGDSFFSLKNRNVCVTTPWLIQNVFTSFFHMRAGIETGKEKSGRVQGDGRRYNSLKKEDEKMNGERRRMLE